MYWSPMSLLRPQMNWTLYPWFSFPRTSSTPRVGASLLGNGIEVTDAQRNARVAQALQVGLAWKENHHIHRITYNKS